MNRCKEEKLAAAMTVAEADKLLVEMGCVVPGGASHTVKKEAAAAMVWMRAHRLDKTEQFDALPEESKAALKGLYTVLPGASGMHWSKKIFRMFDAFSSADSPVKEPQAPRDDILPRVGELELADEQARPPDDAMDAMGVGGEREERARLAAQRQREDAQLLAAGIESHLARQAAKRHKDVSVLSPESLKNAAEAGASREGAAGWAVVKQTWLPCAVLEASLPEDVLAGLWLAGKWNDERVARAMKSEERRAKAGSRFENQNPLWGHRLQFYLGMSPRDVPDLNIVGKNLALITRMCLPGREAPLAKMVTGKLREAWEAIMDKLALPGQIPESDLRESFDIANGLMKERELVLRCKVVGCGPAGEEVIRAVALQTKLVKGMWGFLARGMADGLICSPGRSTANAVWATVLGPVMDQRTNSRPNGDTSLASAQTKLGARYSAEAQGSDGVRRRLAPALAQTGGVGPAGGTGGAQAAPTQLAGGWAPVPAWGPPPPAYVQAPPMWAQLPLQLPPSIAPPPAVLRILPPPSSAPPPMAAPPSSRAKSDGWTGQPSSTAMLGDRGVVVAEQAAAKNHCVMCSKAHPGARVHMAWECAIKLARRAGGEPCPGFDVLGNRVPSAWTVDGNLQPAAVQAWVSYIDRWGLEVAASSPGPPRLS